MPTLKSSLSLGDIMTTLDWVVFACALLATALAVFYGDLLKRRKGKNSEEASFLDLIIMGRQLTLPLFMATLVATWYGGIFGVTQIAFNKGIYNFITQGVFWYIAYIIFALFIVQRIAPFQAITLPDLIGKMFGPKSAKLSALFNFFNVLPIAYTISLGIFLQMIFGGELIHMMAYGVTFVIFYSMWGGFRAVVFSDLVQFFVMCLGVLLVIIFSIKTFGGMEYLKTNLPDRYFELTGGESIATTFVWGLIALSTLIDPNFYQRCFAAKSEKIAKKGILLSTVIWILFDLCTTFGAMYAKATIPEADSSQAYLIYAVQILPAGLRGLMLAGILATILSTLDSYLFLAGTTLSYDLVPKKLKGRINLHHIGVVSVGIISIMLAQVFEGNIKTVWKTLGSYSAACLLLPVLCGYIFPKKISDKQFVFSCLMGVIGTTYWRTASHTGIYAEIDELYAGLLATSIGLLSWQFFKAALRSAKN